MSKQPPARYIPQRALCDDDLMPFGKHKDQPMSEVPASYLHWLWFEKQGDPTNPVMGYIRNNLPALQQETPDLIWD